MAHGLRLACNDNDFFVILIWVKSHRSRSNYIILCCVDCNSNSSYILTDIIDICHNVFSEVSIMTEKFLDVSTNYLDYSCVACNANISLNNTCFDIGH